MIVSKRAVIISCYCDGNLNQQAIIALLQKIWIFAVSLMIFHQRFSYSYCIRQTYSLISANQHSLFPS